MKMAGTTLVSCVVVVYIVAVQAVTSTKEKDLENAIKILEHLTDTRKGLSALKTVVGDIDTDLQREERSWDPTCHIGGGNPGIRCHMKGITGSSKSQDWVNSNMLSPGKRTGENIAEKKRHLDNLSRKRKGLDILKRILSEMDADLIFEQKRMCRVNLGGHCATESAASVADQWHYLNSPLSPGRKRRDTKLYNSLIQGKILH